jgi:hypothetical protein
MRSWLVMILLRQLATVVPDAILKDRTRVEKIGQRVLEIRKDFLIQGQYNIYDRNGLKGTFNLSRVFPANSPWGRALRHVQFFLPGDLALEPAGLNRRPAITNQMGSNSN